MLYKSDNETIVYNHEDGVNISKIIHSSTKADIFSRLHSRLKNYKHEVEPNFNYYNEVANSVTSIMTRCPMILNMMVTRGYKDVLFVGYYHQGRSMDWLLDQSSDKIIDDIPFVTRNLEYVMDFKTCLQFLPVIAKLYGYNINFTCVRPPEERHRGAIDWVYQKEGIKQVDGNKQYKFGSESFTIPYHDPTENEGRKYDAVVFAGMPKKYDDTQFTSVEIKQWFAQWCQGFFEIFDITYDHDDKLRFTDREYRQNHLPNIVKAFSTRAEWDQEVLSDGGRPAHFQVFERDIKIF
jgi:hypothetical protein